jgi:hypothetical protein
VGAEDTVPDAECESKIFVPVLAFPMMIYAIGLGCDQDIAQRTKIQPHIRVLELRIDGVEYGPQDNDGERILKH